MARSFGTWLKRQAQRHDPIGDLATDFIADLRQTQHGVPSQWTPTGLRHRMMFLGACDEAFEALAAAEAEWRAAQ